MAPEQVRGKDMDHRADIFAFGAVLYEMLSGKRAFQKPTREETMSAILNEDPAPISQVALNLPPELQMIVHRCLEKNPEQRFQSAPDLALAMEGVSDAGESSTSQLTESRSRRNWVSIAAAGIAIATVAVLLTLWLLPPAVPQVEAVTQLTDDGQPKSGGKLVTDGLRIYFDEGQTGSRKPAQVSVNGGQVAPVATKLADSMIIDLAPDNSALLTLTVDSRGFAPWLIPLAAGEPRRVGDLQMRDASFFPDGRIVFAKGTALFVAEKNGSNPRKLFESSQPIIFPSVSPDGRRISFTSWSGWVFHLKEIAVEGANAHDVPLPGGELSFTCCGKWTPDGRYLIFLASNKGRFDQFDLSALAERTGIFTRSKAPVRLTKGPLFYKCIAPSKDGKRLYAVGSKQRGELIRYDEQSHAFVPFLSGIPATDVTFSRDGKWIAYRSYPDYTLWRSRSDGSDRVQLTYPPMLIAVPRISPDGTRVVFRTPEGPFPNFALYLSSMDGGPLRKISDRSFFGAWSPDGNLLALSSMVPGKHVEDKNFAELEVFDLRDGKISVVPDSEGLFYAYWVDRHALVAGNYEGTKLLTFDFRTRRWSELASGDFVNWFPSLDNKFLYCTMGGPEPKAVRIRLSDRKVETITSLQGIRRVVDEYSGTQVTVAPDGSVLLTRDTGTEEVYALNIRWPR
jgi:WD40 repeat protein